MNQITPSDFRGAAMVALAMFVLYNSNGREIASYDSQPTKYAARELLLRGTLTLNHVVGQIPQLAERSGFVQTRDDRYRSAYSPVPAILAAAIAWPFWKTGLIDVRAALAPGLIAVVASALLVSIAVGLAYLTARRSLSRRRSLFVATAFGLGSGLWSTASQTLWQHETAILGLMLAVFGLTADRNAPWWNGLIIGVGLGLAASARLQLMPSVVVLLAATVWLRGRREAALTVVCTAALVVPLLVANVRWFGHILGAAPMLEALHEAVHGKNRSFELQWEGFAGLLISPNRGLLIFSPVVVVTALGARHVFAEGWRSPAVACLWAALAQFALYGSYAVWWGGFTYGPRYMLDVLPLLIPVAVAAAAVVRGRVAAGVASVALACSMAVAAIGAFCYPHDRWNSDPVSVDLEHGRLWDWSDTQILRAWNAGPSPQNFGLVSRDAFRLPPP